MAAFEGFSPGDEPAAVLVPPLPVLALAKEQVEEQEDIEDPTRLWQQARNEMEVLDGEIHDVRAELQQLERRREALAKREVILRRQAKEHGCTEAASCEEADRRVAAKQVVGTPEVVLRDIRNMSMSTPREVIIMPTGDKGPDGRERFEAQIMTPRLPTMLSMSPPVSELAGSKPVVFELEKEGSPKSADNRPLVPKILELIPCTPRQMEDWEHGLECSVAKCGVCGMKFPLDVGAIEQHSLECEAIRQGRQPCRSELSSAPGEKSQDGSIGGPAGEPTELGQAVTRLVSGGPGAGLAGVVAGAGSFIQTIAAAAANRGPGEGASGGGYPAGLGAVLRPNAGGPPNGGTTQQATSGKAAVAVGDRAALLRSRMQQRSRSSQPGAGRSMARWRAS